MDFEKIIAETDLDAMYRKRCERVSVYLSEHNLFAAVFEDSEDNRDASIRYLSGMSDNSILIITADKKSILIPWDENLAEKIGHASKMIPFTLYDRNNIKAVSSVLNTMRPSEISTVEIPPASSYPLFLKYLDALNGWDVKCHENGVHDFVIQMRSQKDEYEIACTKKACSITCEITDKIEELLRENKLTSETDVALLIEKELRLKGAEKNGFDTLAAGPSRSYAIHAFPCYTSGNWGTDGLSILDYGVVFNGYTSDVTLTVAKGKLSDRQLKMIELVKKAAEEIRPLYEAGKSVRAAHEAAQTIFSREKLSMPHGLGHGIGLQIHEFPFASKKAGEETLFMPGNIVTLEPGLYDADCGGVRLENDILILEHGNEILTNSRIIML